MERKCKQCEEFKPEEAYTPSIWATPVHYNIKCKGCACIASRGYIAPKKGYIYIIMNDAWPEWCKVGLCTTTPETRLVSYQTCSPFRDYYIRYTVEVDDVVKAESMTHYKLKALGVDSTCEWFKADVGLIKQVMNNLVL